MQNNQFLTVFASLLVAGGALTACNVEECETESGATGISEDCADGETCVYEEGEETGVCEGPDDGDGTGSGGPPIGCTTDAECGLYLCDTDGTDNCFAACTDGSECADSAQCTDSVCTEITDVPYTFAAVVSTATGDSTAADNPGPDVDAIVVVQGGVELPAAAVRASLVGTVTGGDNSTGAAGNVTGTPNDFNGPDQECELESATNYFAFGGSGGFVAVSFAASVEIIDGDSVKVYELAGGPGNCSNITTERADTFEVYIGASDSAAPAVATDITGGDEWCRIGQSGGLGGITTVPVNTANCN
jgi:hypothetical protein